MKSVFICAVTSSSFSVSDYILTNVILAIAKFSARSSSAYSIINKASLSHKVKTGWVLGLSSTIVIYRNSLKPIFEYVVYKAKD